MQHHVQGRGLGRDRDQRAALLRSLARSLILYGKIKTTEAKAKELRPFIERLVTKGKVNSLAARRLLLARLGNDVAIVNKLMEKIGPQYKDRKGGYTRIIRAGVSGSDARKEAYIEFV